MNKHSIFAKIKIGLTKGVGRNVVLSQFGSLFGCYVYGSLDVLSGCKSAFDLSQDGKAD